MKNYNKVFISYAKEDIEAANKLYDYLKRFCFEPWLDKKELLPGQDWNYEIRKALREADFIVLMLSNISVAKRGYVQREYKLALKYYEEKLESDIYIIPCKINDCDVPESLSKYQWVELYRRSEKDEYYQIIQSLNIQQQKYLNVDKLKSILNTPLEYKEIEIKEMIKEIYPYTQIDINYPQFIHTENIELKILNSIIENIIYPIYTNYKLYSAQSLLSNSLTSDYTLNSEEGDLFNSNNELEITYSFNMLSQSIISFDIWRDCYQSGAAHGYKYIKGHSYVLNPLEEITIEKLFDNEESVLNSFHEICHEKLKDDALNREVIENREEEFFILEDSYPLKWETFDNFYLTKNAITVIFNPYEIAAYSCGHFIVSINYDEILSIHPNLKNLRKIKELCNQ
ncbi:TIR domain-containing protein [uncultured Dysgonomonas sp.]|uniref:TIR domain-containing protein n=1 Tax=uncultured Dysgonomonas sp. TaxID=206096 RepID=A0A212J445_9BACT|nr:TIR domain-containing protein [uncultured Dysgonomonas sp.]SBV94232.1 conserved hypothetical protein [uncultured Dysgonomonas sp.]